MNDGIDSIRKACAAFRDTLFDVTVFPKIFLYFTNFVMLLVL